MASINLSLQKRSAYSIEALKRAVGKIAYNLLRAEGYKITDTQAFYDAYFAIWVSNCITGGGMEDLVNSDLFDSDGIDVLERKKLVIPPEGRE